MSIEFRLGGEQLRDLSILRDVGSEGIEAIIDRLNKVKPRPLKPSDLKKSIEDIYRDRPEVVTSVIKVILSLYTIQREHDLQPEDLFERLLVGINTTDTPWTGDEIDKWKSLRPQVCSLLSHSIIWTVVKALDLSYDYSNLLQNAKIITDIRPVYSKDAMDILGSVISYTLRLSFNNIKGDNYQNLSIAIDEKDIQALSKSCERALVKGQTAKKFMGAQNTPTFISGESE